jgi:3'-phosphoadenosine 5'-phosphosulfate (PAPS) 3'-phosphatase
MKQYLDAAEKAARAAGKLLRENFQQRPRVKAVAAHDIKLEIDVQAQELIGKLLLEEFPEHALYGEEGIVGDQSSDHQWIVDPLDGTVNYFYGIPHFCVSIALRQRKEMVVGVNLRSRSRRDVDRTKRRDLQTKWKSDPCKRSRRARRIRYLDRPRKNRRDDQHKLSIAPANDSPMCANAGCSAVRRSTWVTWLWTIRRIHRNGNQSVGRCRGITPG